MSRIRFETTWQIQRRIFIDGECVDKEVLADNCNSYRHAQNIFKELTGLEPKEEYCTFDKATMELSKFDRQLHEYYALATKIMFNRNFIAVPFKSGKGCFAYGIQRVSKQITDPSD